MGDIPLAGWSGGAAGAGTKPVGGQVLVGGWPTVLGGVFGWDGGIRWSWTGQGKFGFYFCVFFGSCCRGLISVGGLGAGLCLHANLGFC